MVGRTVLDSEHYCLRRVQRGWREEGSASEIPLRKVRFGKLYENLLPFTLLLVTNIAVGDLELAKQNLFIARSISKGHSWISKVKFGTNQKTIFIETCILLYKTLMKQAENLMATDPKRAQAYCTIARRRAIEGSLKTIACNVPNSFMPYSLRPFG